MRKNKILLGLLFVVLCLFGFACGEKKFNVKFVNEGVEVKTLVVKENAVLIAADFPSVSKEGYDLKGWFYDSDGSEKYTSQKITGDITLTALWDKKVIEITITFVDDGSDTTIKMSAGNAITEFPNAVKAAYKLDGWYYDDEYVTKYNNEVVGEDTTLYAKWVTDPDYGKITVTYNNEGEETTEKLKSGTAITSIAAPTKYGYTLKGWYYEDTFATKYTNQKLSQNTTLYACWEKAKFTVTFYIDEDSTKVSVVYEATVEKPTEPSKPGYDFEGWYFGDPAEKWEFNNQILEDVILTAVFTAHTDTGYKVKHYVQDLTTLDFELRSTDIFSGTTDTTVTVQPNTYTGYMTEYETYDGVILGDGSLVIEIRYIEWSITYKYELNGGNFTYKTRMEMTLDFINDYNTALGKSWTFANFPRASMSEINMHTFFFNETYRSKWEWIPMYLAEVGASTNKTSCADFLKSKTVADFTKISGNWIYAFAYEVRGFVLGIKHDANPLWVSADYSTEALGNGFWPTFIEQKEKTSFSGAKTEVTLATEVYKEGYSFDGWYLTPDFSGSPVTKISDKATLYAKWEETNPVTGIEFVSPISTLAKFATHQLEINVLPADTYNKKVSYKTSNPEILSVSDTGLVTANNAGKATITVTTYNGKITKTIEIEVIAGDDINVSFESGYNGTLKVNGAVDMTIAGVNGYSASTFVFKSVDPTIASIDANGKITGLAIGSATIEVALASAPSNALLTFIVTVIDTPESDKVSELLSILINASRPVIETLNVKLMYDNYSGYQQYYASTYGSVNLYLFDNLVIDSTTYLIDPTVNTIKTSGLKSSTEFITVHDTASIAAGLAAHGVTWANTNSSTSIHFTVGDKGVIQDMDTKYTAHHAADGTSVSFKWSDTGIAANGNTNPVIDINTGGYYTINGEQSSIKATTGPNGQILDKSYFVDLGPSWKIGTDGKYYLGNTHFANKEITRGVIGSYGGNLNSTGIEMCVNKDGDIYDTWQRTAKLVSKLLVDHQLDSNRVKQHNNFSGKNCPQSLRAANYWSTFMEMVDLEYLVRTQYSDATIKLISDDTTILSNTGRIVSQPLTTKSVSYTLSVKIGSTTKTVKLSAVVPGTSSWNLLNGMFPTR